MTIFGFGAVKITFLEKFCLISIVGCVLVGHGCLM